MHVGVLIKPEFDFPALDVGNRFTHVKRDGSGLGVGHKATRTQDFTQAADLTHELRGRHSGIEAGVATGNFFDEFIATHFISPGSKRGLSRSTRSEHDNASSLAGSVGKAYGSANQLICFALVNAKLDCHLNGGIERGRSGLLGQGDGVAWLVVMAFGDQCLCGLISF